MTIILDNYALPEKGQFDIDLHVSFDVKISAQEAKRSVRKWVRSEVTMLLQAGNPVLVIAKRLVWRVPVEIAFPMRSGNFSVSTIDVDVVTGEIIEPIKSKQEILDYLETKVKPFVPEILPETRQIFH